MLSKKILIVEDDPDVHSLLRKRLRHHGYECESAYSVEDALAALKLQRPDLVVLDLGFKRANGTAFLRHAQQWLGQGQEFPPIIVLSCFHEKDVVDYVLDIGAKGFLAKPYDPHTLVNMVSDFVQ